MFETRLKEQAHELGFALAGIASAAPADHFERWQEWLERGYAGEMAYLHAQAELRRRPQSVWPDVRSVIMVGMIYAENNEPFTENAASERAATGRVARYARGPDYHVVMWRKLDALLEWLQREAPGCQGRSVVDSAPLLERDFARRAGLGWFGKNTMLISKTHGSLFFLGALLVDLELQPDPPHLGEHCGACTACLDACPTRAFSGPGWLDARRCISYLTIELRSPVPTELRPDMGDWLFGCDVCQDVCPWNNKPRRPAFPVDADMQALDPIELLGLSEAEFRQRFRDTALMRTKRRGLLRNAAIVLGNRGDASALPALRRALDDVEPQVQEAAAWAIEQILQRCANSS
jgi:epoxyqueuosine reductase